jgi:hypothetical protein
MPSSADVPGVMDRSSPMLPHSLDEHTERADRWTRWCLWENVKAERRLRRPRHGMLGRCYRGSVEFEVIHTNTSAVYATMNACSTILQGYCTLPDTQRIVVVFYASEKVKGRWALGKGIENDGEIRFIKPNC